MNRIVFKSVIVCFLLFTGIINSQTKRVKENKVKIDKELIQEAFFLLNSNEEEKAYTIAKKLKKTTKSRYALMNSNMVLAYYFNRKVTIDSSIFYARKALEFNTEGGDSLKSKRKSAIYNLLGRNYNVKSFSKKSKKWYIKGIEESQKYKEKYLYYANNHGLALVYYNENALKKALSLFKECLIYKGDKEITYGSYINLGMIYGVFKNYISSNIYLNKAYEISLSEKKLRQWLPFF